MIERHPDARYVTGIVELEDVDQRSWILVLVLLDCRHGTQFVGVIDRRPTLRLCIYAGTCASADQRTRER